MQLIIKRQNDTFIATTNKSKKKCFLLSYHDKSVWADVQIAPEASSNDVCSISLKINLLLSRLNLIIFLWLFTRLENFFWRVLFLLSVVIHHLNVFRCLNVNLFTFLIYISTTDVSDYLERLIIDRSGNFLKKISKPLFMVGYVSCWIWRSKNNSRDSFS